MKTIAEMSRQLKKIDLQKEAAEVAAATKADIANYNRDQLFVEGTDSEGKKLRPYRNPAYARKKNRMNPLPGLGNPDLYLTGSFARSIKAETGGNVITLFATDSKTEELLKKYGEDTLGLTAQSKSRYWAEIMRDLVARRISLKTGVGLSSR